MLLEREIAVSISRTQTDKAIKRAWIALALLLASMVLNLPPYYLTMSYYYLLQICSLLAIGCVLTAVCLSILSLRSLFKHGTVTKGRKFYLALVINLLILSLVSLTILLWIDRLINGN